MFCCGGRVEDFFIGIDSSGEEVGKNRKHRAWLKPKKVGYAWGKRMPPIKSELLGNNFGSFAKVLKEGRMQVVGFGQKSR